MSRSRSRRSSPSRRPLITFLLVASFGILFAGCSGPDEEEFVFTADEAARFEELAAGAESGAVVTTDTESGSVALMPLDSGSGASASIPVLDLSMVKTYDAMRSGPAATGDNLYRITNEFSNIRATPAANGVLVERVERGALVTLVEFKDSQWAKVKSAAGKEGYVSVRYIAKVTTEDKLAAEKKKFEGQYYVNFGFVNVRKSADPQAEKLGELPGQSFVRPKSIENNWAKVAFNGGEGYVTMQYLSPFLPSFYVRQDAFTLPILQYRYGQTGMADAFKQHIAGLKNAGVSILTFRDFYDVLLAQEQKDTRVPPNSVLLAITNVTPENVREISDLFVSAGVKATLFIEAKHVGLSGITQKTLTTLLANGLDIQSGGQTGDDLRSLTNSQLELELKQSRQILEENVGRTVFAIAYPEGGVNDRVMQIAQTSGYLLGVGIAPDRSFGRSQFLRLPSFQISSSLSAAEVLKIVKGQ